MNNLEHKIIISIHVPVTGFSRQREVQTMEEVTNMYTGVFPKDYIVLFLPHRLEDHDKVIIEAIDTSNLNSKPEDFENIYEKFKEMKNFSISNNGIAKYDL